MKGSRDERADEGDNKSSLYQDIQGLARAENQKILDQLFANHNLELGKLVGRCQAFIMDKEEQKHEETEQKKFEAMIEKKLEEEYTESLKAGRTNFTYLYQKNKQGILLYPRMRTVMRPWTPEYGLAIERVPETGGRYLLSHSTDPETEARRTQIQESFLREGEIESQIIPGPFKTPLTYMVISLAFFYKFWNNLN